ncbi:glycosyltransferase family 39 protein [Nocardioides ferulae]|uniref:glycosyltransferase family 39 protein n=1 Tax=Nocardioides ferulae TaxID=2340821 RepID=UPI000EACCB38|nr:glycosyltransferase family 39 protein [Nocardioides ferulae]
MNALDLAAPPSGTIAAPLPEPPHSAGRRQLVALAGQLVAGVGNLLVSVALARLLLPGEYAAFTAFLGAYVLLHTVASSVTAATALDPTLGRRLLGAGAGAGVAVGAALVLAAPWLAPVAGVSADTVRLLGAAAPSAPLLALARGRLYGLHRVGGTAATLVAEPLVRAGLGLGLLPILGPVGAAAGVVAAGYAALLVAVVSGRGAPTGLAPTLGARRSAAVAGAFLLVAVIAAQDVIIANSVLGDHDAGIVAAVATVGGAAYFATATVPMVLMPSTDTGPAARGSLRAALLAAAGVSLAVLAAVALLPAEGYALALGDDYAEVADYAPAYVAAMAALGVGKVFLARLCMLGRSALATVVVAVAVADQLVLLLRAETVRDIVLATAAGCAVLLVGSALAVAWATRADHRRLAEETDRALTTAPAAEPTSTEPTSTEPTSTEPTSTGPDATHRARRSRLVTLLPLWIALAVGVVLRMVVTRSIWLDEAISIRQAQLPLGEMLTDLQENDVHPPGFDLVLWAVVHGTGSTAEWVVRLPSLVAGALLVPVFYAMAADLWDRRTARVAAFVAAIAPVAVWYGQEARMYALWMLFATLAVWMQLRVLRSAEAGGRGGLLSWAGFVVAAAATMYLQWFAALPLVVQHLVFLATALRRRTRRTWWPWLLSVAATLALLAPMARFLVNQGRSVIEAGAGTTPGQTGAEASAVGGANPDVYAVLANLVWTVWGYHADEVMIQVSALWPVLLLVTLAALGRGRSRAVTVMLLVAVVPAAVLFAIGFERRQLFELRYFTATVPLLLLLVSRAVATWARGPVTRVVLPGALMASLAVGLVDEQVNQSNPRTYDFRAGVEWIADRGEDGDVVVYAPEFLDDELTYYSPGLPTMPTGRLDVEQTDLGLEQGTDPAQRPGSVFVFGSFLEEEATAGQLGEALARLEEAGWVEVEEHHVANVTVWEFQQPDEQPDEQRETTR